MLRHKCSPQTYVHIPQTHIYTKFGICVMPSNLGTWPNTPSPPFIEILFVVGIFRYIYNNCISLLLLFFFQIYINTYVHIHHVCVGTSRGQKRAWDPLGLELQEVSFTVGVLGTKLEASGVAGSTCNSELSFQPFVL